MESIYRVNYGGHFLQTHKNSLEHARWTFRASRKLQSHFAKKTALSTPGGRSGLPKSGTIILGKILEHAHWTFRASNKVKGHFPGNGNLERCFHAALHLVCMVLEGELSICLVAAKQPSNNVTDPREESLAGDA